MKCPKCQSVEIFIEHVNINTKKLVCQKCSFSSIIDGQGKRFLTGDKQSDVDTRKMLIEG